MMYKQQKKSDIICKRIQMAFRDNQRSSREKKNTSDVHVLLARSLTHWTISWPVPEILRQADILHRVTLFVTNKPSERCT